MADLDDFFAKKDRKKARGKKFTTTEEIAKKLEETGKRVEKQKLKEKTTTNEEEIETPSQVPEEDEWRVYEEEKKDYTGLKIGNMAATDETGAESEEDRGTGENSSDGETTESGSKQSGPWKKHDVPEQKEEAPAEIPEGAAVPASGGGGASAGGGGGGSTYKAPHQRNVGPSSMRSSSRRPMKNVAPDINSEEYFPTLSGKQPQGGDTTGPWARRKREEGNFEEVRNRGGSRGYGAQETQQAQAPKLSLGNKYGALSQDQS